MTLLEIKKQSLALIEELKGTIATPTEGQSEVTDDPDIKAKLNYVINQVQTELAQIKRIGAKKIYEITDTIEQDLPSDFFQVDRVNGEYFIYGNKIVFKEVGNYDMYYYKYPTKIDNETADDFEMELSLDCLNAMPYGVASDVLKSDVSVNYRIYADRYNELKKQLRLSNTSPMVKVVNGIGVI